MSGENFVNRFLCEQFEQCKFANLNKRCGQKETLNSKEAELEYHFLG